MIFLLIVIYRSPMFFLIPLVAVIFAELLSRSLGYGLTQLGVTVNGQSSSIMSVLVLGAGTDYALLLVARYREELHRHDDKHEAMGIALASAGPAIFASALTVIAALLCLTLAKVNGTAGLGPIAAMGVACAALSALTLLPALLAIFGRRAFWPFVPHTAASAPGPEVVSEKARRNFLEESGAGALARVVPRRRCSSSCLSWAILLNSILRAITWGHFPSLIFSRLDRSFFRPYELRRHDREHAADATHGFWSRLGERIAVSAAAGGARHDRRPADPLRRPRHLLHRPDQRRQLPHRSRIGRRPAPARQELPLGSDRPDRHRRPRDGRSAGRP